MTRSGFPLAVMLALVSAVPSQARQAIGPTPDVQRMCSMSRMPSATGLRIASPAASAVGAGFDAVFYGIALDLTEPPLGYVVGSTRIVGRATVPELSTLRLDFDPALQVDSVLSATGQRIPVERAGAVLSVTLDPPVPQDGMVDVTVLYRGEPAGSGFGSFSAGMRTSGDPYVWTLSEPYGARTWWPGVDHPSDKADSVDMRVTVPLSWTVASNGVLQDVTDSGKSDATWSWAHRYPIATYLVSIAAGIYDVDFQTYVRPDSLAAEFGPSSFPVEHYAYPGSGLFEGWSSTTGWHRVLDVLPVEEWWFGPYPFENEKYGHAQFTWGGGMEHQTISSMGGSYLGLVAHELAHQWYGDAVGPETWPHLWLNEGFATMAELLTWQTLADAYPGTYEQVFGIYYGRALNADGTLVLTDTTSVGRMFSSELVYSKGAMVLHMLRSMYGDETFREILRTYALDPTVRYGTATTADFRRVAESVTGENLGTFFRQWVTEGFGHPEYEATWVYTPRGDGWVVRVTLSQVQESKVSNVEIFEMPIDIRIVTDRGVGDFTVQNAERSETFSFVVDGRPLDVQIDPHRRVLRSLVLPVVYVGTERDAIPETVRLAAAYPNPATDRLSITVESSRAGTARVRIVDATGRTAESREMTVRAGTQDVQMDISDLAAGLYLLRIQVGSRIDSRSVVVIR